MKDTVVYLALYNHQPVYGTESAIQLEPVCLPRLQRLDIGYMKRLDSSSCFYFPWSNISRRAISADVRRRMSRLRQLTTEEWNTNRSKDAYQPLVGFVDRLSLLNPRTGLLLNGTCTASCAERQHAYLYSNRFGTWFLACTVERWFKAMGGSHNFRISSSLDGRVDI